VFGKNKLAADVKDIVDSQASGGSSVDYCECREHTAPPALLILYHS